MKPHFRAGAKLTALTLGSIGFALGGFFYFQHLDSPLTESEQPVTPMTLRPNPFQSWNEINTRAVKTTEFPEIEIMESVPELEVGHFQEESRPEAKDVPNLELPIPSFPVSPSRFHDESEVRRLLSRVDQAVIESVLQERRSAIRSAIENAEVVERIHNVTFNSANPHLDHRDETYLVSALQNSTAMRKFKAHPDAMLLVFGYASKDDDPRNKFYALNRAKSAQHAVEEHRKIIGFEGSTRSWCVGETDLLSRETDEHCSQHNRAAEIWLVVSDDRVFKEIESDEFLKTTIRESGHGHQGEAH